MKQPTNQEYASIIFRLMFGNKVSPCFVEFDGQAWSRFELFCRKNLVLVRTGNLLSNIAFPMPAIFSEAVRHEERRIAQAVEVMAAIGEVCSRSEIAYIFPKAFMHYPDMGHDIDLWVENRSESVDSLFAKQLGLVRDHDSLFNRVAGKRAYIMKSDNEVHSIEIHHGRTGIVGEFPDLVREVFRSPNFKKILSNRFPFPGPSETIVIQAVQRILCHRSIRISDIILTHEILAETAFDRKHTFAVARQCGAGRCVDDYFALYEKMIGKEQYNSSLVDSGKQHGDPQKWEREVMMVPSTFVIRGYANKCWADCGRGRFGTGFRYGLIPALFFLSRGCDFFSRHSKTAPTDRKRFAFLWLGMIVFAFFVWSSIEPLDVREKKITLRSARISKAFDGTKIIFVTDLHFDHRFNNADLSTLLDRVRQEHPDILIYGGDYVRTLRYLQECFDMLKNVKGRFGTFAAVGNHDYATSITLTKNAIRESGMTLLLNQEAWVTIANEKIKIYGVDDLWMGRPYLDSSLWKGEDSSFAILVTHHPDYAMGLNGVGFDLALSGHTHGGQVSLFGLWSPWVPSKYGNRLRTGIKKIGKMTIVISNGIGTVAPNIRFCTPPDFYVITLEKLK